MEAPLAPENSSSNSQSTVWVTNFAGHIYEKAEQYGKLKKITVGYIRFDSLDRLKFQIANELTQTTQDDYLLISGAAIICVIAAVIWMTMHGKVKLLYWDKFANNKEGGYRVMVLTLSSLHELLNVLEYEPS